MCLGNLTLPRKYQAILIYLVQISRFAWFFHGSSLFWVVFLDFSFFFKSMPTLICYETVALTKIYFYRSYLQYVMGGENISIGIFLMSPNFIYRKYSKMGGEIFDIFFFQIFCQKKHDMKLRKKWSKISPPLDQYRSTIYNIIGWKKSNQHFVWKKMTKIFPTHYIYVYCKYSIMVGEKIGYFVVVFSLKIFGIHVL